MEPSTELLKDKRCTARRNRCLKRPDKKARRPSNDNFTMVRRREIQKVIVSHRVERTSHNIVRQDRPGEAHLQGGLDENWWADSMECYTYLRNIHDLLSDGKTPYGRRFGNHSQDRSFRLVHWLSITLFLRKTSQESINLERKSYLDCSSDTLCTRWEFGRVTYWLQILRSWRRWTHQTSTQKDSMRKR